MCTGEKGIEPLSVVLETTVLPIKLFSRCVVCVVYVVYVCLCIAPNGCNAQTKCVQWVQSMHKQSVYNLHLNCVYNCRSAKLYSLLPYFLTSLLPYRCITVLPYCHIAILPYCRIVYTQLPDIAQCTMMICICFYHRVHMLQVYGKHSKDRSTPETKTTQASENGKKVFHPNFISWSYR